MRSIPINDIKVPVRITVTSRRQLLQVLRGAHHIRDAMEIRFDGVGSVYYICEMTEFNEAVRKRILSRASGLLQRNTPANFNLKIADDPSIPKSVFMSTMESIENVLR